MKKIVYLFILLFSYSAYSQSLSLFNVDASAFPIIKANFFAIDADSKQIINFSPTDFTVTENGVPRTVTNVGCPSPKPLQKVSIAMSIDVSGSMSNSNVGEIPVELGKTTAIALCKRVPMPPNEFALQTCDTRALIIKDFTTNKAKLLSAIDPITANGDNDFVEQLQNPITGLLNIAKLGKYKRVAVLYTDAWWYALASSELQACKDTCTKYDIQFYAVIYSRPEAEPNGIKKSLQLLADATGGILYDGIISLVAAKDIANRLQIQTQDGEPCSVEWLSGTTCQSGVTNVTVEHPLLGLTAKTSYQSPANSVVQLEITPNPLKFKNAIPGIPKDTLISVTAKNADFNVTNITSLNPAYAVTPNSFFLGSGQNRNLTVSYLPADSGYTYTKFIIENDKCPRSYYVSGGYPGKKAKIMTLKLIQPNDGEVYVVGQDTVITWEGITPDDKAKLEYTTDNGANWITISQNARGLSYKWIIPKTPSNLCLARVTASVGTVSSGCDGGEVMICNQTWMSCNLDVDTYRNGDPIPEVIDSTNWKNLTAGAWCYYNNDPANGEIYGKLYNWYAVNDPRGLAPVGWHVPSDEEWTELDACLGVAGGKLKSTGTKEGGDGLWHQPNQGATNESGFSGLPGGVRDDYGSFNFLGRYCDWWSSTVYNDTKSGGCSLYYNHNNFNRGIANKGLGFSVRCVKD